MIKVAIDGGDYLSTNSVSSGINRIIQAISGRSDKNPSIHYRVYSFNEKADNRLPVIGYSELFLPLNVLKDGSDVFLGLSANIPTLIRHSRLKKILFVYDFGFLTYPAHYSNPGKMKKMIDYGINNSDAIISTSENTKKKLLNYYPAIKPDKVKVLRLGLDHLVKKKTNSPIGDPYFLYVGVIKPIKNLEKIFEIFSLFLSTTNKSHYRLVLIGKIEKKYHEELLKNSSFRKVKNNLIFYENITDHELSAFYQHALAVLNYSLAEGFAFPPLEASVFQKPVFVNDLPVYHEYLKTFPNIRIIENPKLVADRLVSLSSKDSVTTGFIVPKEFTWTNFKTGLDKIIVSLGRKNI